MRGRLTPSVDRINSDGTHSSRRGARQLRALEITEAAVLADISVGLCLVGRFVPVGGVLVAFAVTPFACVAARHRFRAIVAAGMAAAVVALLAGGTDLAINALICATLGAVVGIAQRRRWRLSKTLLVAATTIWPVASAITIGLLAVLASLRELALMQVRNAWRGVAHILERLQLAGIAHAGDTAVNWLIEHWWISVLVALFIVIESGVAVAYTIAQPIVRALDRSAPLREPRFVDDRRPADPVPAQLVDVTLTYPDLARPALDHVTVEVPQGSLVTVVGPNGSGKSTFGRVLAGLEPTSGSVERPGSSGLGTRHGTAMVFQRPEAQVLGMRVRDDLMWADPNLSDAAMADVLGRVGLSGMEHRDTATLSGGQLQRLAIAAALVREPRLIVSDESTAMVDREGRAEMMALYRGLAAGERTVVHITHDPDEASMGDVTVALDGGRVSNVVAATVPGAAPPHAHAAARSAATSAPEPGRHGNGRRHGCPIDLVAAGHVYDSGSPWAHRALHPTDLHIEPGEMVVVQGPNGSGKTTLAWIIAGLVAPSEGEAFIAGEPARDSGHAGLSFQHARLQLQRTFVREELMDAAAVGMADADSALTSVGLDPARYGARRVDTLSGGEMRRVAIAGLLLQRRDVIILDEPFAGLDRDATEALTAMLVELRSRGVTIVMVTHDYDDRALVADRHIVLEEGRIVSDSAPADAVAPVGTSELRRPRRSAGIHLFRVLPDEGPLHRVAAATKLVALVALGATLAVSPEWRTIAAVAGVIAVGLVGGRVPLNARPRLPRWFVAALLIGLALNFIAGGPPNVHVLGFTIGCGAAIDWLRATSIAALLLVAALLVSWTTPFADVPPALRTLTRPIRWLRVPVDEWLVTTAIGLRCLPLMTDEVRTLLAARQLRSEPPIRRPRSALGMGARLLVAITIVAVRRAADFADALIARGAVSVPAGRVRLRRNDVIVAACLAAAITVAFV